MSETHTHLDSFNLPIKDAEVIARVEAFGPTESEQQLVNIIKRQDLALKMLFKQLNLLQTHDHWWANHPYVDDDGKQQPGVIKSIGVIARECKDACILAGERLKK